MIHGKTNPSSSYSRLVAIGLTAFALAACSPLLAQDPVEWLVAHRLPRQEAVVLAQGRVVYQWAKVEGGCSVCGSSTELTPTAADTESSGAILLALAKATTLARCGLLAMALVPEIGDVAYPDLFTGALTHRSEVGLEGSIGSAALIDAKVFGDRAFAVVSVSGREVEVTSPSLTAAQVRALYGTALLRELLRSLPTADPLGYILLAEHAELHVMLPPTIRVRIATAHLASGEKSGAQDVLDSLWATLTSLELDVDDWLVLADLETSLGREANSLKAIEWGEAELSRQWRIQRFSAPPPLYPVLRRNNR